MQLRDRVGGRLKLQDLQVLMAVAEAGSMRKAAALLNTTQPSISRAIADLEATVGLPLLDRHPHGVEPKGQSTHFPPNTEADIGGHDQRRSV